MGRATGSAADGRGASGVSRGAGAECARASPGIFRTLQAGADFSPRSQGTDYSFSPLLPSSRLILQTKKHTQTQSKTLYTHYTEPKYKHRNTRTARRKKQGERRREREKICDACLRGRMTRGRKGEGARGRKGEGKGKGRGAHGPGGNNGGISDRFRWHPFTTARALRRAAVAATVMEAKSVGPRLPLSPLPPPPYFLTTTTWRRRTKPLLLAKSRSLHHRPSRRWHFMAPGSQGRPPRALSR